MVETIDQIDQLDYKPNDRLAYVTQTTLSVDDTREIIKSLKFFPKIQVLMLKIFVMRHKMTKSCKRLSRLQ